MKFRFDGNRRRDVAVNKMVNEIFGLGVFPLFGMNRERFLAERVRIALAQLRKLDFLQRTGLVDLPSADATCSSAGVRIDSERIAADEPNSVRETRLNP